MQYKKFIGLLLAAALFLAGCSMQTVDEMYRLPERSEDYNNLQSAINQAMTGLEYCAPLAGENRQTVQMADLDGDGTQEYILFAKSSQEKPLRILLFRNVNGRFINTCVVECNGSAFDQVEYVNMDGAGGVEIVVGRQISDQVIRSVSVYTFHQNELAQLVSVNYTKFLTTDLDGDNLSELFLLRPGQTDSDNGVAELYTFKSGTVERYNEVGMSQPADKLKRIITGKLDGGKAAVYIASAVGDTALITDVYTLTGGMFVNVTVSNESGTSIHTMRNYYVYADDIDNDSVVELPSLITMKPRDDVYADDKHHLIRWYAMTQDGSEVDKMYTYHNFVTGWYLQLNKDWAPRLTALGQGNQTTFYLWNEKFTSAKEVMTIYTLTGQNREEYATSEGRFVLNKTESVVYAAKLTDYAVSCGATNENAIYSFRMIQADWKTGET